MIRFYDDVAAIAAEFRAKDKNTRPSGRGRRASGTSSEWYGRETIDDTLQFAATGDASLVPEAEALIEKLETQIEVSKRVWERAPVGNFYAVPEVLAGLPTPGRRLREVGDEHAPIAIFACSTISAGIRAADIRRRGTTILALVLALARVRPVQLWTVATCGGEGGDRNETVLCTRIETAPLHLALACWTLTSPGFARRLNYDVAEGLNGFRGGWPKLYKELGETAYCDYLAETLSPVDPSRTLMIKPLHSADPLLTNPVKWLNDQIKRFVTNQEDLAA